MCALVCPRARTLVPFRDLGRSGAGHVQRLGLKKKKHATFRAMHLPRNRLILASVDSIRSDRGSHQFASSLVRVPCTPHLRRSGRRIFEPLAEDPFAPGLTTPAGPTEREMWFVHLV
jgi:hypothetical protein